MYLINHKPEPPQDSWWATPSREAFKAALAARLPQMPRAAERDVAYDPIIEATASLKDRLALHRLHRRKAKRKAGG